MAVGSEIRTYFQGQWHDEDLPVMRASDHGAWLGTSVFDGARYFEGVTPDLLAHCDRVNRSAKALSITPTVAAEEMAEICRDGLRRFSPETAVYIRPMYWAIEGGVNIVQPKAGVTGFCIALESVPMPDPSMTATLGTTRFRRPVLEDAVVNAKAGCLYPNNQRMLADVRSRGFSNALVADALGNVAETATSNIFMVRDGVVFTPIANGTFLAGITRARHIANMRADGIEVHESVLSFQDIREADELFMSGNATKVTPVTEFEGTGYQVGPVTRRVRELYWDWALSGS